MPEVFVDKQTIIDVLKQLDGVKRKLHQLLNEDHAPITRMNIGIKQTLSPEILQKIAEQLIDK